MEQTRTKHASFRNITIFFFLIIIALILITPSFYRHSWNDADIMFFLSNFMIGFLSILMIVIETRKMKFSLHIAHWLFQFSFFFVAPLIQYLNDTFMWGVLNKSEHSNLMLKSNLAILAWQIVWIITAKLTTEYTRRRYLKKDMIKIIQRPLPRINVRPLRLLVLLILCLLSLLLFIRTLGFSGLFARGAVSSGSVSTNSSLAQVVYNVGKSLPVVLLVCTYYKYVYSRVHKSFWFLMMAVSSILVLLLNFPTGIARFWAATVYLGLLFTFFNFHSKNAFVYALISGLFLIFPVLGMTRNAYHFGDFLSNLDANFTKNLLTGDYDAYSMVNYSIMFIEKEGITFGRQLLGVLLFFVPRAFWPNKPIGSGATIAHELHLTFDNISCPPMAEGLINFGVVGLFLFAVLFSYLTKKYDLFFWFNSNGKAVLKSLYPFMIGLFFFMLRGDLLSTFSLMVGFSFAFFLFIQDGTTRSAESSHAS